MQIRYLFTILWIMIEDISWEIFSHWFMYHFVVFINTSGTGGNETPQSSLSLDA